MRLRDLHLGVAFAAGEFKVVRDFLIEALRFGVLGDGMCDICGSGGPGGSGGLVGHEHCVKAMRTKKVLLISSRKVLVL